MTRYIDPELPFTRTEIRRAFRLTGISRQEVDSLVRQVADLPERARAQNREAAAARVAGSTDPERINDASWFVSDEFFAVMATLSEDAAARVDRLMEKRWSEWTEREVRAAMALRRMPADADPPRELVIAARRKISPWKGGWTRKRRRVATAVASLRQGPGTRR